MLTGHMEMKLERCSVKLTLTLQVPTDQKPAQGPPLPHCQTTDYCTIPVCFNQIGLEGIHSLASLRSAFDQRRIGLKNNRNEWSLPKPLSPQWKYCHYMIIWYDDRFWGTLLLLRDLCILGMEPHKPGSKAGGSAHAASQVLHVHGACSSDIPYPQLNGS